MDANKLIMMGYKLKLIHMEYLVYLNENSHRLLILKDEKVVFKKDDVWNISRKGLGTDSFLILYGTNENMAKTVFKIAIDSYGSLLVCEDDDLGFWNFFFYETNEIWIARKDRTIYYLDKTTNIKYEMQLQYKLKSNSVSKKFYCSKIVDGVLLFGNTLLSFNNEQVYELNGTYKVVENKIIIQELGNFGFLTNKIHMISLLDGKLYCGHGVPNLEKIVIHEVYTGTEKTILVAEDLIGNDLSLPVINWLTKVQ